MQRKATKNTRGPNSHEKAYHEWVMQIRSTCGACLTEGPVIGHHCEGATFKHNKILCGHWFFFGLCLSCDNEITHGSRAKFREINGPQCEIWEGEMLNYVSYCARISGDLAAPEWVHDAIMDWGK